MLFLFIPMYSCMFVLSAASILGPVASILVPIVSILSSIVSILGLMSQGAACHQGQPLGLQQEVLAQS